MKQILISFFFIFFVEIAFSNGLAETDKYPVSFTEAYSQPELLINRLGDMYLFYLDGTRLIQEVKYKDSDGFKTIENELFNFKVNSIKSYDLNDSSKSLLISTSDGNYSNIYLLNFNYDNELKLIPLLTNNLFGDISDVNILKDFNDRLFVSIINNKTLYFSTIIDDNILETKIIGQNVEKYVLVNKISGDEISKQGYYISEDNSLFYFTINNNILNQRFIASSLEDNYFENIYLTQDSSSNTNIYLFLNSGVKIYTLSIEDVGFSEIVYPDTTNYKPYFIYNESVELGYYKYTDNILEILGHRFDNIKNYSFYKNNLLYLTKSGDFYAYDLISNVNNKLEIDNIVDFYILNKEFTNYICLITFENNLYNFIILKEDSNNFEVISKTSFPALDTEKMISKGYTLLSYFDNLYIDPTDNKFLLIDHEKNIKKYKNIIVKNENNNFSLIFDQIFLSVKDGEYLIEVTK